MQSIRSRLMVFQVVQAIRSQSSITFDFVVLLTLARFASDVLLFGAIVSVHRVYLVSWLVWACLRTVQ